MSISPSPTVSYLFGWYHPFGSMQCLLQYIIILYIYWLIITCSSWTASSIRAGHCLYSFSLFLQNQASRNPYTYNTFSEIEKAPPLRSPRPLLGTCHVEPGMGWILASPGHLARYPCSVNNLHNWVYPLCPAPCKIPANNRNILVGWINQFYWGLIYSQ